MLNREQRLPHGLLRGSVHLLNQVHGKDDPYDLAYVGGINIMMEGKSGRVLRHAIG